MPNTPEHCSLRSQESMQNLLELKGMMGRSMRMEDQTDVCPLWMKGMWSRKTRSPKPHRTIAGKWSSRHAPRSAQDHGFEDFYV